MIDVAFSSASRNATSTPCPPLSAPSVLAEVWMVMYLPSSLPASIEISSSSRGSTRGAISMTVTVRPEAREDRRELDPHRARADDDQALRDVIDLQDLVGGDDRLAVRGQAGDAARLRPRGQDHVLRLDAGLAALALDHDAARAFQPPLALEERDLVLLEQVALDALAQPVDDAVLAALHGGEVEAQPLDDDPVVLAVLHLVEQVGGVEEGLGRDAAAQQAGAARPARDRARPRPSSGPSGRPGWRPRSPRARCR